MVMDESKVEAVTKWSIPKSIKEIQAFMGLASFYRKFIKNFSFITAPMTDCLKKGAFYWGEKQQHNFDSLKRKLVSQPVLKLPKFDSPFEVAVDASGVGIRAVLSQGGHPVEFFSEKLSHSRQN